MAGHRSVYRQKTNGDTCILNAYLFTYMSEIRV